MNNGYVYVASLSKSYYKAAVRSAISLKDNYPDAKITLFTHEEFVDESDNVFFENIITGIPVHIRAKMYGIAKTPYDRTLYLDCDTEIYSSEISKVFEFLDDGSDIKFSPIISHVSKSRKIDENNQLEYHGGVILYNNKPLTISLMKDWYDLYLEQISCKWHLSQFKEFSNLMQPWDQFTMWYLLHEVAKYKNIKSGFIDNGNLKWNYIYLLEDVTNPKNEPYREIEPVIYHYTIPRSHSDESCIVKPPGIATDFR